jgi:hypothetical protein
VYDWNEPFVVPPPTSCPGQPNGCIGTQQAANLNFVSIRASTIVHEGWHAWGEENLNSDYVKTLDPLAGHEFAGAAAARLFVQRSSNPFQPNFCSNSSECDHFRPHLSSEFPEGQLINAGRRTDAESGRNLRRISTFHSVYQTEIEFLCDVADYSPDWMPYSVREMAAAWAKTDSTTAVLEPVPYFCGSTRPFWTRDPGATPGGVTPACLDGTRIDCGLGSNGNCGAGFHGCGPDGCCVKACSDPTQQCNGLGTAGFSCGTQCNTSSGCCEPPLPPPK